MKLKIINKESELEFFALLKFCCKKKQLPDVLFCLGLCAIAYVVLKLCYPYPSFYGDSFEYLLIAFRDIFYYLRPFGYPAFLQLIKVFSSSIHAIFIVQLILYFLTSTLLLCTIKFYYPIKSNIVKYIFYSVIMLSPVALYMANAIMSDMLFCCGIYLMITLMIVYLKSDSILSIIIFSLAFGVSLFTRYSAMFFPIVFIPIFLFVKNKNRWIAIALTCLVFIIFYQNVSNNVKKIVGKKQFSTGLDGWSWANNAIHIIPHIDLEKVKIKDKKLQHLHSFVILYEDHIKDVTNNGEKIVPNFLWVRSSPLKQYLYWEMQRTNQSYPTTYVELGKLYGDYGKWLVLNYPIAFCKYYLFPNVKEIFFPKKTEMIEYYKAVEKNNKDVTNWFDVSKRIELKENYPLYAKAINKITPYYELMTWMIFMFSVIMFFLYRETFILTRSDILILSMIIGLGFIYYSSTTFASVIAVRYWIPMGMLKMIVPMIVLHFYENRKVVTELNIKHKN